MVFETSPIVFIGVGKCAGRVAILRGWRQAAAVVAPAIIGTAELLSVLGGEDGPADAGAGQQAHTGKALCRAARRRALPLLP